jgi:arsenate reductase (thioredoxin)
MPGADLVGRCIRYHGYVGLVLRTASTLHDANLLIVQEEQAGAAHSRVFAVPEAEWSAIEVLEDPAVGAQEADHARTRSTVLFVCTGNSARSQIAEGLLRAKIGEHLEVLSAGTHPRPLRSEAIEVMHELGIEIGGQRCKSVDDYLGKTDIDYLVTLSDIANAELRDLPRVLHHLHWSIPDPALASGSYVEHLDLFRRIRDDLAARIDRFLSAGSAPDDQRGSGSIHVDDGPESPWTG